MCVFGMGRKTTWLAWKPDSLISIPVIWRLALCGGPLGTSFIYDGGQFGG